MRKTLNSEELTQVEKLEIIEDRFFKSAHKCVDLFEGSNSFQALRAGAVSANCSMRAMRDNQRYHANGKL